MKKYLYKVIENGNAKYYSYESSSRKNTTGHWCDWNRQVGKFADKFEPSKSFLDTEKTRKDEMINDDDIL